MGLLPMLFLASACSLGPGGGADPGGAVVAPAPANPDAEMRPDLLVVEPARAVPGDVVALTFPEETTRGILFVLDERVGDEWFTRFYLTSNGPGEGWQMSWHAAGGQGVAVEDIGVGGPGPDHVPIPEPAEPGAYRICTGNAGEDFCAPIEIVNP
jgi:hypothetical protein